MSWILFVIVGLSGFGYVSEYYEKQKIQVKCTMIKFEQRLEYKERSYRIFFNEGNYFACRPKHQLIDVTNNIITGKEI